ncbi:MAG: hypothetical protein ACOCVS_00985 [Planctomycetota bacterium]
MGLFEEIQKHIEEAMREAEGRRAPQRPAQQRPAQQRRGQRPAAAGRPPPVQEPAAERPQRPAPERVDHHEQARQAGRKRDAEARARAQAERAQRRAAAPQDVRSALLGQLRSSQGLRSAMLLHEVLGPPVARRPRPRPPFRRS